MKNKYVYRAYVQNESGAGERAGSDTNLKNLKKFVRRTYGAGWTVIIEKIENDNGVMDFAPVGVARFTISENTKLSGRPTMFGKTMKKASYHMTDEQIAWVNDHGGGEYMRGLVDAEMNK
jgi:hypothetical protein